jgi:tripartite-type tricarboxylate transporter receptor subunit TctC
LGVNVIVVDKPGGGGGVGLVYLKNSKPDGYTIGMSSNALVYTSYCSTITTPIEDYEFIAHLTTAPAALTVRADSPWETLEDFITAAKSQPGLITNANDTPGGASHIAAILLEETLGIKLNKIPYAGFAPSVAALAGGHVDATTVDITEVVALSEAGDFRILGVLDRIRHYLVPDVQTITEQGYNVVSSDSNIMLTPKGVPQERLDILEKAFLSVLEDPKLVETLRNIGFNVDPQGRAWTEDYWEEVDEKLYKIFFDLDMVIHPKP